MKKVYCDFFSHSRIRLLVLLFFFPVTISFSQVQKLKAVDTKITFNIGGFYESLPVDYDAKPEKKFPLLIFFHGSGECGNGTTDISKVSSIALPKYIKDGVFPASFNVGGETFSFIVICPQMKAASDLVNGVDKVIDYAISHYRVDEQRIYLTGLSLGGLTSWWYVANAQKYADRLAGLLLVCPGVDTAKSNGNPNPRGGILNAVNTHLPVWITTNSVDQQAYTWRSIALADSINKLNPTPRAKLSIFQANGHDAWTKTYNPAFKEDGMNVYEWMLTNKNNVAVTPSPPVADAGSAQTITLPVNSVTLDGSKSTAPSGSIKSYAWTKLSGPASGTISTPSGISTKITNLQEGTYEFQLQVTDSNGKTATAKVTVKVNPAPLPPVANAGNPQTITLPSNSVTLNGSASTAPSGTINSYQWSKISGPTDGAISNSSSAITTATNLVKGVYVFQLKITDSNGATSVASVSITVNAAPVPPVADAGNAQIITLPTNSTSLDGSASTAPAGNIAKYEWSKMSGPTGGTIVSAGNAKTSVTGLTQGLYEYELKVTDNLGSSSVDVVSITVNPAPAPPVADAGADKTIQLPTNTITLDGSASISPDGTITDYIWSKVSGPSQGIINDPVNVITGITNLTEGVYQFQLKIIDNNGNSSISTVTITVKPAPLPPVAVAGSDKTITLPVNIVMLDGSGSTAPAGSIVSYEWSKVSGPLSGALSNTAIVNPEANNLAEGVYKFQLKVTDNNGLNATATITVTVKPAILPPAANAGNAQTIVLPQNSIMLDGSKSTAPSGSIVSYEWKKLSGGNAVIINTGSVTTTVNDLTEGVYTFELKVTDSNGQSSAATVTITVKAAPLPPVANAGSAKTIILPQNSVALDGSKSSSSSGSIVSYEWKKISGPLLATIADINNANTTVADLAEGVYEFELKVTDSNGLSATATVTVTVMPLLTTPVADAGSDITITLPVNSITLDASGSTAPSGTIDSYLWTKVSGSSDAVIGNSSAVNTTVTSLSEGIYEFELKITDNNGQTSTAVITVTVNPALLAPVSDAGSDQTIALPQNNITLDGRGSTAPSGSIDSYEWSKISGPADGVITSAANVTTNVSDLAEGVYVFELKITDNNGNSSTSTVTVTVNAAPLPPVASAGVDQTITLPVNSVILDGSGSTAPSGSIVSYEWSKVSGPSAGTLSDAGIVNPAAGDLAEGVYKFQVKVTDNNGQSSTATVTITVKPAPLPPVANAGSAQIITLPLSNVTLDGSRSTAPSGSIVSYEWKKLSGGNAVITDAGSAGTTVSGLGEGVYTFELKVTDNNGLSATATITVTVKAVPVPPIADAGDDITITLPVNSITLDGSGSTAPSGSIVSYSWRKVSGPSDAVIADAAKAGTIVSGLAEGVYEFELKVTDSNGLSATTTITVMVNAAPLPPVADAGSDTTITLPANSVALSGGKSIAPSGNIIKYEWSKISGSPDAVIADASNVGTMVNGLTEGIYVFELKVTDNNGNSSTSTATVTVKPAPLPPVANAGADQIITLPLSTIKLDGSNSTAPSGSIDSYAWTKISGPSEGVITSAANVTTMVNGLAEGVYQFQLKIVDNNGNSSISTVTITVKPAPLPPVAVAGSDKTITLPVNIVMLDGSGSAAPAGSIVSYEWSKVSGPLSGALSNTAIVNPEANNLAEGVYKFQLKVTDNNGLNATATVTVTVKPAILPPAANAGNAQTIVLPQNSIMLDGSKSTAPSGSIVSYEWKKLSGGNAVIINTGSVTTTVNDLTEGVYTFELKVTDSNGQSSAATVTITVKVAPPPPVANAGDAQTIVLPVNTVKLDGSKSSSAAGNIVSYEWSVLSGPEGSVVISADAAKTDISNLTEGTYQVQLKVTDNLGGIATSTVNITVKPVAKPPVANAGSSQSITLPVNVATLNATLSTAPEGKIVSFVWTKISGPQQGYVTDPSSGMTTVAGLVAGTYQFQVKVTDNNGNSSTASVSVIVNPAVVKPPVADAGEDIIIHLPVDAIQLDGSKSYAQEGSIKQYQWIVVSSSSPVSILNATTANPSILSIEAGSYLLRLFVVDTYNGVDSADINITVIPKDISPDPPVAYIKADTIVSLPQTTTLLDGTASYSVDKTITKYKWSMLSGPSAVVIVNSEAASTELNGLTEGEYEFELMVTDSKGGVAKSSVKLLVNNPGARPDLSASAKVYPNPVQSILHIELSGSGKGRTMIDVFDVNGRKVLHKEVIKDADALHQTLNMSDLKKGVYLIEVIVDYRYRSSYKIIKM
ncbi:MAG: PKD domain-containing protein [Agriterribacter sp.]